MILKELWSLPNTILSWLLLKCVNKKNTIGNYQGVTIVKAGGWIQSICLGKFAISTYFNRRHEYAHVVWSKRFGWFYLSHFYYAIYAIYHLIRYNNSTTPIHIICSIVYFILWYWFNEYLAKKWEVKGWKNK